MRSFHLTLVALPSAFFRWANWSTEETLCKWTFLLFWRQIWGCLLFVYSLVLWKPELETEAGDYWTGGGDNVLPQHLNGSRLTITTGLLFIVRVHPAFPTELTDWKCCRCPCQVSIPCLATWPAHRPPQGLPRSQLPSAPIGQAGEGSQAWLAMCPVCSVFAATQEVTSYTPGPWPPCLCLVSVAVRRNTGCPGTGGMDGCVPCG